MNQEFPGFGQSSGPDLKRLFLAGLLTFGVLMIFNQFFVSPPQKVDVEAKVAAPAEFEQKKVDTQPPAPASLPVVDQFAGATPQTVKSIHNEFEIPVTNQYIEQDPAWPKGGYLLASENLGANISALSVFGYKAPIKLFEGAHGGMFFLKSRTSSNGLDENSPYEVISSKAQEITYQRITPAGLKITRRYHFVNDNYFLQHEIEVENLSQTNQKVDLDLVFRTQGTIEESSFFSGPTNEQNFIARKDGSLERHAQSAILEKPLTLMGSNDFIGFEQRYFLISVLPLEPRKIEKVFALTERLAGTKDGFQSAVTMSLAAVELAPAGKTTWKFDSYVGPKQLGLLKIVGNGLEDTVNFGWFGIISRPLLWLLVGIYGLVGNFGFAIILLTLLIKLLTYPLTQKSFVSMQQVKKIGPEIKALEKKYGHDRTMLSQKQMELYKEKGVNPMAGCLPMFLQFPIWIALYQMLSNSVEIYQKPFAGWLLDLTQPDPYYVLPVLMGITMVIQQLMQPVQDDQKAMKYAMLGTSVLFTFIMLNLPSGLSLYMLTNNILTLIQQMVIKKRFELQTA